MLRSMALACAVLVLAITTLSSFIRLSRAQLECQPWPQCRTQQVLPPDGAPVTGAVAAARVVHRVAASAALLVIIGMLVSALASAPALREAGRLVLALLVLALFLAVLGRMAADSRLPVVVLANLLGGFAMVAVCARLLMTLRPGRRRGAFARRGWAWTALALLMAVIAAGGLAAVPGTSAAVVWMHAGGAAALVALLALLAVLAWRRARLGGVALLALVAAGLVTGALLELQPPRIGVAVAHNLVAALLLALLASLLPVDEHSATVLREPG